MQDKMKNMPFPGKPPVGMPLHVKIKDHIIRRLIRYMKPWWGLFAVTALLSLLGALFNVLATNYMKT